VRRRLGDVGLVYCADTGGFPYGTKGEAEVSARVAGLLGRLAERLAPSLIVIACNTASTIALSHVRGVLGGVGIVGTVPAIKPAAEQSRTRVIGVLGTEATVRQPYVADLAARFAGDCLVLTHGAAALVEAAEAKLRGEAGDTEVYRAALDGLLAQPGGERLDTVVLACTHFPLVEAELAAAAPRRLSFVHGADGIARRVATLLGKRLPAPAPGRFLATRDDPALALLAPALKARGITEMDLL
jgi:glutamate racemase